MRKMTVEEQIEHAWDVQQIKNLMGRHAYYHEYNRHDWEMQELFVQKEENKPGTSFGQGHGFQHGYELVADNYDRKSFVQWFAALEDFIPEDPTIERTIENAGMGCMIIHEIASPLIEIAEDGLSAQGSFDGNGQITEVYPDETTTKVMFERYNCDFIKEDGEWKLQKMFIATDICLTPAGTDERENKVDLVGAMKFVLRDGQEEDPETTIILNHPMLAYTDVLGQPEWPFYPEPYKTFADTNHNDYYGRTGEEEEE